MEVNALTRTQRGDWRLSVGPRSGDRGARRFAMVVVLPNPGPDSSPPPSVDCEFPIKATVGQIKVNTSSAAICLFF